MAINLDLAVDSAQIQKVAGVIDFTKVACAVKRSSLDRRAKCLGGSCGIVPVPQSYLSAAETKLPFFVQFRGQCHERIQPFHRSTDRDDSFSLGVGRLSPLPFITHAKNRGLGWAVQ